MTDHVCGGIVIPLIVAGTIFIYNPVLVNFLSAAALHTLYVCTSETSVAYFYCDSIVIVRVSQRSTNGFHWSTGPFSSTE